MEQNNEDEYYNGRRKKRGSRASFKLDALESYII